MGNGGASVFPAQMAQAEAVVAVYQRALRLFFRRHAASHQVAVGQYIAQLCPFPKP